jgi:hypothetical protein
MQMSDLRYAGMTGYVTEACDIARDEGVSIETAFAIQQQRAAHREQEYRDAIAEIESNVIYGVDFAKGRRKDETIGAL